MKMVRIAKKVRREHTTGTKYVGWLIIFELIKIYSLTFYKHKRKENVAAEKIKIKIKFSFTFLFNLENFAIWQLMGIAIHH